MDEALVNRIFPRIEALAKNPRPRNCHKLRGEKNLWRIRIGDYQVIYAVYEKDLLVDIIAVRHRKPMNRQGWASFMNRYQEIAIVMRINLGNSLCRSSTTLRIPNPHQSDIGKELLTRILKQARIDKETREKL